VIWVGTNISFPTGGIETQHQHNEDHCGQSTNGVLMAPGEILGDGRYELRDVLGRGAMSEVRDGRDLKLSRPVAIKQMFDTPARPWSRDQVSWWIRP